jgi:hypothetical protein
MWHVQVHTGLWWGDLTGRNHLEGRGLGGSIILISVFKKWDGAAWFAFTWPGTGTGGGLFEFGNEPSDSINCGELLN